MPIKPLPLPVIPPAPQRSDPATFEERNDAAVEFQFNVLPPWIEEQVNRTFENAQESAQYAGDAEDAKDEAESIAATVEEYKNEAAASAASAADDAVKTAADRKAVEEAIIDGPVLSVNGKAGIVTLTADEVGAVEQGGSAHFTRYDLISVASNETLDLNVAQVFRVDASSPRTISFSNVPNVDRAMVVVIIITGNELIAWPSEIIWDDGHAPIPDGSSLRVVLIWDGAEWSGSSRIRK